MADLAASAVTVNDAWTEGGTSGKRIRCLDVTLVLTGQGTTTNKIPASVLRLKSILTAEGFRRDSNEAILALPSYDGSSLLLIDLAAAAGASHDNPSDITDTIRGVVTGQPAA